MARKNPLGMIKDVAVASLKVPMTAAGSAVGLAKTTTGKAADAVTSLIGGSDDHTPSAPSPAPPKSPSQPGPVNVVEELGLDPTPVAKPKPASKPARKPVTRIDAAADASHVDVTPADVAKAVAKD